MTTVSADPPPAATGSIAVLRQGSLAVLEVRNARRRNAISSAMWESIATAAAELRADSGMRALLVRGEGAAVFSAGADISEFERIRGDDEQAAAYDRLVEETVRAIETLPFPTVAMLRGPCFGAAMSVAAVCDFRVCDETSSFALPAVRLGLGYDVAGIHRLLRLVGLPAAKEILLTGRPINANRAKEIGFVHSIVHEPGRLEAVVHEFLEALAANAPLALSAMKTTLHRLAETDVALFADCQALLSSCNRSADYREGVAAFREKRKPHFRGA